MTTIKIFARQMAGVDVAACREAGTEVDDVWAGEHTTALADHLGRGASEDEIAEASKEYRRAVRGLTEGT
jgi:hypothetical protein